MKADKLLTVAQHYLDPKSYMRADGSEVLFGEDWDARKKDLWFRCGGQCEEITESGRCPDEAHDPHHIIARSKGRDDRLANLQALCRYHHDLLDSRKVRWSVGIGRVSSFQPRTQGRYEAGSGSWPRKGAVSMTRSERQEMLKRHSEWLAAHPWWRWGIALWFSLAVLVFAAAMKYGLSGKWLR